MKTKIYGGSDDLIEIEGAINDELGCYGHKKPIVIEASDGTSANIFYDYDGEWKINVANQGAKYLRKVDSVGDDAKHTGEFTLCTSYSDILVLDDGIEWVKVGRKKFIAE